MITIDLTIDDKQWGAEDPLLALAQLVSNATFNLLGFNDVTSELSLLFTNDFHIRTINAEWRNKDQPTNVLSFPAFPIVPNQKPKLLLGDIVLAWETINAEAEHDGKSFQNHLAHLMVHGLLHLLGYDHENEKEAEEMEKLEREVLKSLAMPDPYAISFNDNLDDKI